MAEVMFVRVADFNRLCHVPQYRKRRLSRLIFSEHLCRKPIPSGPLYSEPKSPCLRNDTTTQPYLRNT
jgi:hypothetical protein